jgi:hypothetical protein
VKYFIDELDGKEEFVQNKIDKVGEEEGEEKIEEDLQKGIEEGEKGKEKRRKERYGRVSKSVKELIELIRKRS